MQNWKKMVPLSIGAGLASTILSMNVAFAQGYSQHGYGSTPQKVCWIEVQIQPEYKIVKKPVVKEAERYEVKEHPAVYGETTSKVLVKAGEWETKVTPAVYEERERQVLTKHEHVTVKVTPPVYKHEKVEKKVVDHYGHVQAIYVTQQTLVEPGRRDVHKEPAVYSTEKYKVLVKPENHEKIYHEPVYEHKIEKVLVKAAYQEKIHHPAVVDYVEAKVEVRPAGVIKKAVYKQHGHAC